jgi:citrate synthase
MAHGSGSERESGREVARAGGLDGVVVAETRLSDVDGEAGRLTIAGASVESLAGAVSFEEVAGILVGAPAEALGRALGAGRVAGFAQLPSLGDALARPDAMDALRAATAHLTLSPLTQPRAAADVAAAGHVIGALATFAAAWHRRTLGLAAVEPDPTRSHAEDYLRMVGGSLGAEGSSRVAGVGRVPADAADATERARVAALDAYLVTVVDHGMNASTFTARVIASTRSDLVSAIVGALGALKGPLHGGAPGPVLDMLDAITADGAPTPAHITAWLEGELAAGRRIMGMGHRIYRVRDPRAFVLERALAALERAGVSSGRLGLARAVERAAEEVLRARHPERPLRANVEFYTAVLLDAIGLPRALFTPTFAVSRAAGWCAHVAEQRASGRLLRPSSRYVGSRPDEEVTLL